MIEAYERANIPNTTKSYVNAELTESFGRNLKPINSDNNITL